MKILQPLYIFWVFLVFTIFMLLFLPFILIPMLMGKQYSWFGYKFLWLWSWVFSQLTFIRYKFYGRENLQPGQSYIYVSNHTSFLDIPGLRLLIPGEFRPIAKKELLKIPVFGLIAKSATVIVDRTSTDSRRKSVERMKEILSHGISALIFVEGTQNRTKEVLQPFKDGAFRIGIETQLPLLPLVVIGAGKLMPPSTVKLWPGTIRIYAGPPIPTAGLTLNDSARLKAETFAIMKKMIEENTR